MIRRHLSLQLVLIMLLVALVPLLGAAFLTLHLLERSITHQVRSNHEQLARVSGAMIQNYIDNALNKLKNIGTILKKDEDPRDQARRLNTLLEPPDLFLEVGYWTVGDEPRVRAQVQQQDYGTSQSLALGNRAASERSDTANPRLQGRQSRASVPAENQASQSQSSQLNRAFSPIIKQYVYTGSKQDPLFAEPARGNTFVADSLEFVQDFPGLPLSVPAPGGAVLIASLDFRPISQMLTKFGDFERAVLVLVDKESTILASSRDPAGLREYVEHAQPVGQAGWEIVVREPTDLALAPLRHARLQAMLWFGLACAMAIGLAGLLAGRVLHPVRALARAADALGRGDFSVRTGIRREDEIGQLAQAFDRMAAAVQQLDQMKSEFVAHVSHELRTPLTSAKMALANVQEGISGKESLARVQQDLDRLIKMVNQLLDVARLERGIELAGQPTDLGALTRSSVEVLRPLARVTLEVSGAGETLDLDPGRVQQIVLNLVDNALKYAKSRVDVLVRGREVRVTDDGPGVPPEARERIFEKFGKVETGPKPPGVGLGLSIARKLAQLHGGSLVCEGNTFVLRL